MASDSLLESFSSDFRLVRHILSVIHAIIAKEIEEDPPDDMDLHETLTFLDTVARLAYRDLYAAKSAGNVRMLAPLSQRLAGRLEEAFTWDGLAYSTVARHHKYPRLMAIKAITTPLPDNLGHIRPCCPFLDSLDYCKDLKAFLSDFDTEVAKLSEQTFDDDDEEESPVPNFEYDSNMYESYEKAFSSLSCICHPDMEQDICLRMGIILSPDSGETRALDLLVYSTIGSVWGEARMHVPISAKSDNNECSSDTKCMLPNIRTHITTTSQPRRDTWRAHRPQKISCMSQYVQQQSSAWTVYSHHILFEHSQEGGKSWYRHKRELRQYGYDKYGAFVQLYRAFGNAPVSRLIIAAQMACALSYIHGSTWLHNRWSRENIVFFDTGKSLPCQPYLRVPVSKSFEANSTTDEFHEYPQLLELGIMLLELEIGMSLENFFTSYTGDLTPSLEGSNKLAVANFVFQNHKAQILSDNYRKAIEFCLNPDVDDIEETAEAEAEGIRRLIFNKVFLVVGKQILSLKPPIIGTLDDLATVSSSYDIPKRNCLHDILHSSKGSPGKISNILSQSRNISTPPAQYSQALNVVSQARSQEYLEATGEALESTILEYDSEFDLFGNDAEAAGDQSKLNATDGWIDNFKRLYDKLGDIGTDEVVKVAILDSGIDLSHQDFKKQYPECRIKSIRSWVDNKQGEESPTDGDQSGHGTFIASLLLDLAPNIHLYIARITETRKVQRGPNDFSHIAEAIKYARTIWKVDIISMSFGFPRGVPLIGEQIKKAIHEDEILVFAAASNDGADKSRAFPARLDLVFAIHSTDAHGEKSPFNPSPIDGLNLSILGECIRSAWPDKKVAGQTRRLSGTSFATPVAVALAAFFLLYVSRAVKASNKYYYKPRTYAGMMRLFLILKQERQSGYQLISPFKVFSEKSEVWILEEIKTALSP